MQRNYHDDDYGSDSDSDVERSKLQEGMEEVKRGNEVAQILLQNIQNEVEKLTDENKKDEFYVNLVNNASVKKIFQSYTSIESSFLGVQRLMQEYDVNSFGLDEEEVIALINKSKEISKNFAQIQQKAALAEAKLLVQQIAHPEIKSTVTFVPKHLEAADVASVPKKEESVNNINRMFAKLRAERNETALDLEEVQNNSCDFGVTAQL